MEALCARFRHFDAARAAPLFHPVQPADGVRAVRGQGEFPAVVMVNGCIWYHDKARRPVRQGGAPMKSQAPPGTRPLLIDDPTARQLILVEGEGHAVALRSVGWVGICAAGGVDGLLSNRPEAREVRRQRFEGRDVWILFDYDQAGREAISRAAARIFEAGASRVSVVERPDDWPEGADVEDWLAGFETPELALAGLTQLLGAARWQTQAEIQNPEGRPEGEPDELSVMEHRIIEGGQEQAFLVTVYDEAADRCQLAVLGPAPTSGAAPAMTYDSVQHDAAQVDVERGWQIVESWAWEGVTYRPVVNEAQAEMLRTRQLVLPGPPLPYGTSEGLWADSRAFLERWLVLRDQRDYDTLVAFAFLSWRLWDERAFESCPYLRFYGPPGSGKSHALQLMRLLCWRAFSGQTTPANLHRFMEYYKSVTLVFDEFHLAGRSKERQAETIDTLNFGSARSSAMIRCDRGRDGVMVPNLYRLFGPKLFAGYGHDEHEGLARRTVAIDMAMANPPDDRIHLTIPDAVYAQAFELRRRLLTWRLAKAPLRLPDPDPRAAELIRRVGRNVAQNFYPLVVMVPAGLPAALENVYAAAEGRKRESREARQSTPEAIALDGLAQIIAMGRAMRRENGDYFVPAAALQAHLTDTRQTPLDVAAVLKQIGLPPSRQRPTGRRGENAIRGYLLSVSDERLASVMSHWGIPWPPASPEAASRPPL